MTIKAGTQTIPEAAVIAAAQGIYKRHGGIDWDSETESIHGLFMRDAHEALVAAGMGAMVTALGAITTAVDAAIEATGSTYGDTWNSARMAALLNIREVIQSNSLGQEWAKIFGGEA